ncbi:MOSC N-terminal beta barrel domain-containing protein [Acidovorax sp. BLS4]|uniref:MOSC domain-containing protein n=1 Tax=Acidovorax sp. BLS4 TaxID=3273430 RepID=UPI00294250B4|nr:MOSC N-terminal beta barrel domain-containing protein [Paracidovorax avenae]WOI45796.1 MOSC N-terminal beta barrel domain-containing protein [Paracidovorax avenae]
MTFRPDHDLAGTIARLFVHPVKSCAGIEVRQALLTDTGLDLDRAWMVVDAAGHFLTQRTLPRMALVRPQLKVHEMVLRAPGMLALHVAIDQVEGPATVRLWDDTVPAWDMGPLAAQWFTDFLGQPCRMVRFDPEHRRLSSPKWTDGLEVPNLFSDGFPLLLASQASLDGLNERLRAAGHAAVGMERFRPNIVVDGLHAHDEDRIDRLYIGTGEGEEVHLQPTKPCARCPIPDIDPATAASSPEVGDMMRTYRHDRRLGGAVTFGMNAIVREGAGRMLRVGQPVAADLRFD